MALISIIELIDLIIMTLFVGYIFKDSFKTPVKETYEPLDYYSGKKSSTFDNFKFAILVTAPAIILHEFAHKFVAMGFGLQATFNAAYMWLFLGLVLKLLNFGFIFFVPAYVSISGGNLSQSIITSAAGPLMNLILWLGSAFLLKGKINKKFIPALSLTKQINMFLFIFNIIPIPGFDGYHVFSGLFKLFF